MDVRTWKDNADEYGAIERGEGGWSLAVLVACSVENGVGTGSNQHGERSPASESGKVSTHVFAARADCDRR